MATRPASPDDLEYVARDLEHMENPAMARRVRACMNQWLSERDRNGLTDMARPVLDPPEYRNIEFVSGSVGMVFQQVACIHGHSLRSCAVKGCIHYSQTWDPDVSGMQLTMLLPEGNPDP